MWGRAATGDFDHKTGPVGDISDYAATGTPARFGGSASLRHTKAWTDGTPTASASGVVSGENQSTVGNTYSFDVPADTTNRQVKIYWGCQGLSGSTTTATLTATLSDASASPYDVVITAVDETKDVVTTITYAAAAASQTLDIVLSLTSNSATTDGRLGIEACTLVEL